MEADEIFRTIVSPSRQDHVRDHQSLVRGSHLIAVGIDQHFGQVKELRDELLDVGRIPLAITPGGREGSEQPVGIVKLAALQVQEQSRVRFLFGVYKEKGIRRRRGKVSYINSCKNILKIYLLRGEEAS